MAAADCHLLQALPVCAHLYSQSINELLTFLPYKVSHLQLHSPIAPGTQNHPASDAGDNASPSSQVTMDGLNLHEFIHFPYKQSLVSWGSYDSPAFCPAVDLAGEAAEECHTAAKLD